MYLDKFCALELDDKGWPKIWDIVLIMLRKTRALQKLRKSEVLKNDRERS